MKRYVFYAAACLLSFTGCVMESLIEGEVINQKDFGVIQFDVQMEKEVLDFPVTKSMPEMNIGEPIAVKSETEGDADGVTDVELTDLFSRIDYMVYKEVSDGVWTFFKKRTYVQDGDDFGIVYDTLQAGNYRFLFLAHSSVMNLDEKQMTVSFDDVSDTFYLLDERPIYVAEDVVDDVVLRRVVSRIEFQATDTVHTDLDHFNITVSNWANGFDLSNETGITATDTKSFSDTFTDIPVGTKNHIHSFYTFVNEEKLNVVLQAFDKRDEEIRKRTINNIVPQANKIIRYKGRLYSRSESEETFTISIYNNGKWDESPTEEELPEYGD